jgi:hypothetical protein
MTMNTRTPTRTPTIIPLTPMKLTSPIIPRRPKVPPPLNTKTAPAAAIALRNAGAVLPAKGGALPIKGATVMPAILAEPEVIALMPTAGAPKGPNWAVIAMGLALGGWAFAYVYRSRAQTQRSTM